MVLSDALTGTPFLVDREPDATSWAEPGEWLDLKRAQRELQHFDELFERCYVVRMELRLGLLASGRPCGTDRGPGCVVKKWTTWLEQTGADYPRASRLLAELLAPSAARPPAESLRESFAEAVGANSTAGLEDHVLMEAAKLVELKKQGSKVRDFLRALQQLLQHPFGEIEGIAAMSSVVDDPKAFWKGTDLTAEETEVSGSLLQGSKRKTGIAVAQRSVVRLRSVQEQQKLIETARAETQMSLQQKLLQIASKAAGSLASLVK
eukprot:g6806.t1